MKEFIQPYQYNFIENQAIAILQMHQSVNDPATINTMKTVIFEKIRQEFLMAGQEEQKLLEKVKEIKTSSKDVDDYLETLKKYVIPFKETTDKQLKKVFAKTKKLNIPKWEKIDLSNYTFYGWNDIGKQRKYIVLYQAGKLVGVEGTISPTIQKGYCSICHTNSELTLFMSKVKADKEGTYTSRGNYICYDSDKCNQQIKRVDKLNEFIENVKYR